jgi:hypothetical protein
MLWFIYLFPIGIRHNGERPSISIRTKRKNIERLLSVGGVKFSDKYGVLEDDVLSGIGKTGVAYLSKRYEIFRYFLIFLEEITSLSDAFHRPVSLDNPWNFGVRLDDVPKGGAVPFRHALAYFMFPDVFERMVSSKHKKSMVDYWLPQMPSNFQRAIDPTNSQFSTHLKVDAELFNIRRELSNKYETDDLDFYLPPLADQRTPEPEGLMLPLGDAVGTGAVGQVNANTSSHERMHDPVYHQANMLLRIEDLEFGLEQLNEDRQQPVAGIGHNQPPDDMVLLAEIRDEIADIRRDIEILKTRPVELPSPEDRNEVSGAATRLERKGAIWRNSLGDIFVDYFSATAGQEAGRWFVILIAGLLVSVTSAAIAWVLSASNAMPF